MKSQIVALSTLIALMGVFSPKAWSQDDSSYNNESLTDLYIVGGCGIVGAVLGLSTLSFVDKPEDHTRNVLMGAAIGIVAGVGVVAYNQANKSQGIMGAAPVTEIDAKTFSRAERLSFNRETQNKRSVNMIQEPMQFNYQFSF